MSIYSYINMVERIKKIKGIKGLDKILQVSTAFKLLSDPTRLKILCLLFDNHEGLCVYEIAEYVGVSQSAASHQLAKLEAHGIVSSYRDGQMICYAIIDNSEAKNLEKMVKMFRN